MDIKHSNTAATPRLKRAYASPTVRAYGSIRDITRAVAPDKVKYDDNATGRSKTNLPA